MTVKEILSVCATCIGREDVVEYLKDPRSDGVGKDTVSAVSTMVRLLNIVLTELASSYIPMFISEKITTENGRFNLSNLCESALEIEKIFDDYGNEISYKISGEYVYLGSGIATVKYKYIPKNYDLEDQIGYTEKDVSKMTLACGLSAEFSISEGDFEQAVMWHKRFVDGVSSVCLPKSTKTKSRYWA